MKLKKETETKKEKRHPENAKHLTNSAKGFPQKHPRGNFFGTHRWFPYNINE